MARAMSTERRTQVSSRCFIGMYLGGWLPLGW